MSKLLVLNEVIVEGGGEVLEAGEFFALQFFLFLGEDSGVEGFLEFEEVPEDAGQFVSPGGDGFLRAEPRLPPSVEIAKVVLGSAQPLGGQAQGCGHAANLQA